MSKQVNSFILPDNIIKDMKDKIKETKKLKLELGFALCINKDDNQNIVNKIIINKNTTNKIVDNKNTTNKIITKGTECIGTKCSIKTGQCKENQTYLGNYHTHPRSYPTMSITDMVTACSEQIECIGSVPLNKIRCFTRKIDTQQCIEETKPFEAGEHEILEKRERINSILRNPKTIAKTNIIKLAKDILQYDKQVSIYNKNRYKLLNKNFNRIDIS